MKCNGNFNLAINTLMEKARKGYFKIKKIVGLNNSCKLLEKLFDSLIIPIITYCSEIWGIFSNFKDSEPFEKLHLKFIKEILGVHCKTSNDACRAELGRIPLKGKILFSSIKYLEHILSLEGSLVNDIFYATNSSNPWFIKIKSILQSLGFSFLNYSMNALKTYLKQIKIRINDQCIQSQNARIKESSKLEFFKNIYSENFRPPYIDLLKSIKDRSSISKIRLSAHSLMIEKGRYQNIDKKERKCVICKNDKIEDEEHFSLHCKVYQSKRVILFSKLKCYTMYNHYSFQKIANLMLNSSSDSILFKTDIFFYT